MKPRTRKRAAGVGVILASIGWPVSQLTFASDEPPTTLGLSWLAIVLTCVDVYLTADVRNEQE